MKQRVNNTEGCLNTYPSHLRRRRYPVVLSIAGSDSSGGAGIQADIKTLSALGVYGATAITAITAQNTCGVHAQMAVPAQMVYDQIIAVVEDVSPSVVKIGMLANVDVVCVVAEALMRYSIPIILDPVMVSSSGHRLLAIEAQEAVIKHLLPMSMLITPNIPEMAALTSMPLSSDTEKMAAASHLMSRGARAILLKGGHEEGATKSDILYRHSAEGIVTTTFTSPTIATHNVHGTGCTLSSAIAAFVARGYGLVEAVDAAKRYVYEAIEAGADVAIGGGFGPVNHLFDPQPMQIYEDRTL